MKKLLALMICFLLPLTALADGLPMYEDMNDVYNPQVRQYLSDNDWFYDFHDQTPVNLNLDQLVPVYAYPSEDGWRAAEGKAAVSLKEPFTALGWTADEQWLLIDYEYGGATELGERSHRIGYISRDALPEGFSCPVARECLVRAEMKIAKDGYLHDDINGLSYSVAPIEAGETVTVLGYVNYAWAFVECSMDGKPARLFIPMAYLEKPAETEDRAMMAELEGLWLFTGGGEILGDGCRFDGQGTVQLYAAGMFDSFPPTTLATYEGSKPGAYSVYPNTLGTMRYPSAEWVLEIRSENGGYERMGIQVCIDAETGERRLDVQYGPGGGGYVFVEDDSGIEFVTWPDSDDE